MHARFVDGREHQGAAPEELPEPPEDVMPLDERRGLDGRRPSVMVIRPER